MRTEEEDENCFVLQAQKRGDGHRFGYSDDRRV